MKCIFFLATAVQLAVVTQTYPQNPEAPRTLEIDTMSLNIRLATAQDGDNQWTLRKEMVCDVIRRHSPAVIGVQEALHTQLIDLRNCLPEYAQLGVGRDGGTQGEYSAILYRAGQFHVADSGTFWLSDTPEKPSIHWGNACIRICTWARLVDKQSGLAFYFYNTHLDHQSQPSREKSVKLIASTLHQRAHPDPFILTGDFNAAEDNPAVQYLLGTNRDPIRTPIPLVDSFRSIHPDARETGTFNRFQGRADGPKIDYIFVAPNTTVLAAGIDHSNQDGRYPSDHFPVTARVRLESPDPTPPLRPSLWTHPRTRLRTRPASGHAPGGLLPRLRT